MDITKEIAESVNIPVIASGGAGTMQHFADVFTETKDIQIPIILCLQGTNAELAKQIIDESGMPILSAIEFQESADQVQKALS